MKHDDFVHLNTHSDYSLQTSIASIDAIVSCAANYGQPAVALTDSGNLFGAVEFSKACQKHSIKPIIGCELWIAEERKKNSYERTSLIVLCKNAKGFLNLKKLSSIGYQEGFYYVPRIDMKLLAKHTDGLVCIAPQYGSEIGSLYEIGQEERAVQKIKELKELFNENFYLELQNHGQTAEYQLNAKLYAMAKKLSIATVAGNDCHYVHKEDAEAHGIFLKNGKINRREFYNEEYYVKTRSEMEVFLKDYPEALDATVNLAEKCSFDIQFPGAQLPEFPIPEGFENAGSYLRHLVFEGIKKRYSVLSVEITQRVEYELDIMIRMGYSGYFLIVWDIVSFAHKSNIPVGLGRGSAAGSIVAYALGITGLDPLKYGLLFERFLNPERVSMPDIDSDFCVNGRQQIINYIKRRYGDDHVGQIITFSSLQPKGALRDIARILDFSYEDADEIAKLIPPTCKSLADAKEQEPKLSAYTSESHKKLFTIAEKMIGTHRHASLHAAGVVIGKEPLIEYVPLYKDPKSNAIATQYTMDYLEECGLVKMDILGLRTVTIIANAEKEIQESDPSFSVEVIPEDDEKTFSMLSDGKSGAVFQFESPGMIRALRQVQPTRINDLIALNALYRPGPMEHIETYADVKHGRKSAQYHLDVLKSILEETYGVIVYQEQVMEIARIVAGYSLGNADILRRVMGKKKKEEMKQQLDMFVEGAVKNGYQQNTAKKIFKLLEPFAGYGFNKSHAAAYGVLAYRTAYLKAHYPLVFFVAMLNAIASNLESVTKYLHMCKDMGIRILPPDVNYSNFGFSIEDDAIRYGFAAIKTISEENKQHIPDERKKNGAYTSVLNVIERMMDGRGLVHFLEAGIAAGIFDSVDSRRAHLWANKDILSEEGKERLNANKEQRMLLFSEGESEGSLEEKISTKEHEREVHLRERMYLGIYLTWHPLREKEELWSKQTTLDLSALDWESTNNEKGSFGASKNHYLICYVDKVRMHLKDNYKIYSGKAEDFRGNIEFIYRIKSDEDVQVSEQCVCALVGHLRVREDRYVFWVSSIIEDLERVQEIRLNDTKSAAIVKPKLFKTIHLLLHCEGLDGEEFEKQLKNLQKDFVNNFGPARVVFHMHDDNASEPQVVHLPPGLTVNSDDENFIKRISNIPSVEKVWCV